MDETNSLDKVFNTDPDTLDTDSLADIVLDDKQAKKVLKFVNNIKVGMKSGVTLVCGGVTCPMSATCPLFLMNKAPVNNPCPFETYFTNEWLEQKYKSLNLDKGNYLDRLYASDLTQLDILEWRISMILAQPEHAGLTVKDVKDIDIETGKPIAYETKEHPLLNAMDRIHNKRSKLLKDLLATRYDQAKMFVGAGKMGAMANRLSELQNNLINAKKATPSPKLINEE